MPPFYMPHDAMRIGSCKQVIYAYPVAAGLANLTGMMSVGVYHIPVIDGTVQAVYLPLTCSNIRVRLYHAAPNSLQYLYKFLWNDVCQ